MVLPLTGTANATNSITKVQSGLVTSDSLTTGDTSNWTFGGTATSHDYYEDFQGLHIGVKSPKNGQWVNYYAHLPQPDAQLFHTTITIPDTTVADGVSNVGLYVEGSDYIPHVGCEAYADSTGYYWDVEQSSDAGQTYTILYISQPSSMSQTQDCTIITNGSNYLKVYIGTKMVFSSTTMNLGMSTPFITFVQDDTSSSSAMHYATYSNYYVTANENIKVTNNPSNAATVKIVDSSGNILASSAVTSGTGTLNVGKYSFPLAATINVYDSSGSVIASSPASMYGGDVFSVTNTASTPQSPTGLVATIVSSSQINLSWTAPNDDGGSPITGYKIERSTNGGTFSVLVSNTANTATSFSDTSLTANTTYTYRVSAINAIGTSPASNTSSATTNPVTPTTSTLTVNTQDSDRNTIIGYYTELYQNGNLVDSGYTPYTFTLNNGQTYTVDVVDYGKYEFDHWLDTGSVSVNRVMSISSNIQITAVYKTVPQFPTGLTATAASSTQVNLLWSAPTDNGGSPITGYTIERSLDSGTTWNTISSNTGSTATTFSDTGLTPNTTYTYRVSAINVVGTGSASNIASATSTIQLHSIILAQPGLVVSDSLTNETMTKDQLLANQQFWRYGGSATVNNTPYDISRDPQGFHIGVQATNDGNWTGFYGVAPSSNAVLFHAVVTTPVQTVP
ncbi:MAG TPA: fibronectin type III domain-containing protein, partial [Candidatus Nitrosotalea sp.]|nr:fibronectin type III domain-containing protein [Candidatus Nitrosotalea sp.]